MGQYDEGKAQQKIIAVLAGMLSLPLEAIAADANYRDLLHSDLGAIRDFGTQVEKSLGVTLNDSTFDAHPTIAELATYCARHLSAPRGELLYIVVCQMPDGSTRERIYAARGHEKAAQQAMDDGAAAVLSVEREDAEDRMPSGSDTLTKVLTPLLVGLLFAAAILIFLWWQRGFAKFW